MIPTIAPPASPAETPAEPRRAQTQPISAPSIEPPTARPIVAIQPSALVEGGLVGAYFGTFAMAAFSAPAPAPIRAPTHRNPSAALRLRIQNATQTATAAATIAHVSAVSDTGCRILPSLSSGFQRNRFASPLPAAAATTPTIVAVMASRPPHSTRTARRVGARVGVGAAAGGLTARIAPGRGVTAEVPASSRSSA